MAKRAASQPLVEVRESALHGTGVFALRRITRGTRVIEYLGERVSQREACRCGFATCRATMLYQ